MSGREIGFIQVYRPGVFDTRQLAHGTEVSGSGVNGYALRLRTPELLDVYNPDPRSPIKCNRLIGTPRTTIHLHPSTTAPSNSGPVVGADCVSYHALAWQYAPNSWGLVGLADTKYTSAALPGDRWHRLLKIAAATDTAHPAKIRVPFAARSLPAPIRVSDVYSDTTTDGRLISSAVGIGIPGDPKCPVSTVCSGIGEISVRPRSGKPARSGKPVDIDGRTAYLLDQGTYRPDIVLTLQTDIWDVLIGEVADRPVPDSALVRIARDLRYATSVTDRSTWFDLDDAFPH